MVRRKLNMYYNQKVKHNFEINELCTSVKRNDLEIYLIDANVLYYYTIRESSGS